MTDRLQRGSRLVVASHNPGKVWEIRELIAPFGLDAVSAADFGLTEPEETEPTFAGNARLKAIAAATAAKLPALADDSGLEVECLGGAPGIYSARWAGAGKDFGLAMRKVAEEITLRHGWTAPGPKANFISSLCLAWPNGANEVFEGRVDGRLVWPPRGGNGFGYDAMFVADGARLTFGEMEPADKYAISHRTRAFAAFRALCLDQIEPVARETNALEPNVRNNEALIAAAASLSTQAECLQFVANLRSDRTAAGGLSPHAAVDDFLASLERAIAEHPGHDEPRWRTLAWLLARAST